MTKIIGIDLGTTNSCVSVLEFDKATVIPNREGARTTPSVVSYTKSGERLVGQVAKRQAASHPRTTVHAVKRLMGVSYREFLSRKENLLYDVVPVPDSDAAGVQIGERVYTPQEISAAILREIADVSADYLGETVTRAVITVPAYFNDAQRQATRDAGRIAGLEVLRVINEPTAAALAYGIRSTDAEEKNIAVYDFGGGTFDISVLNVGDGVFEVLSTTGDMHLGGEDFDQRLTDMLIQTFLSENGIDLRNDATAMQRIKEASEIAKQELSVAMVTEVNLPFICMGAGGPLHLNRSVTREEIESLTIDLVQRSIPACKRALADAKLKLSDIDEVILVGGMTRMPLIRDTVAQLFGKQPLTNVNPDEVVALGAALQGGVLNGEVREVFLMDVTPLSLGIETMGGVFQVLIPRNTTVPCESSEIFTTTQDFQDMVRVHVLQGERELAADNRSIAVFELHGIPAVLRGVPQIEVSFRIDANGIVSVSAKELVSGISQSVKVQPSGALSEDQIQTMIVTAERERQEDTEKKAKIDAANRVRGMMYTVERTIRELGHAISEETKKNALEALEAAEISMQNLDYLTVEDLETYRHTIELHVQVLGNEAYAALMQQ